jgi:hypothetical protein
MRGIPFLHCGTWLYHAARLPTVRRVFHVGGDMDFDNSYRWLAPWPWLRDRKIVVWPAVRRFQKGNWSAVAHEPLKEPGQNLWNPARIEDLLRPWREELARYPLYISLDKDVMREEHAVVNWDSGHLHLGEVCAILEAFLRAAHGRLAGMDIVGDWSPVKVQGVLRRFLHLTEHPFLAVEPGDAAGRNEQTNLTLLETVLKRH